MFRKLGETLIVVVGPPLTDSEKDSVETFAKNMVNSYIQRHGNEASVASMTDADPPNARRQLEDVQQFLDDELLADISESP